MTSRPNTTERRLRVWHRHLAVTERPYVLLRVHGNASHVVVFHRTSQAGLDGILRDGFQDSPGWRDAEGRMRRGVWVSSVPLDSAPVDRDVVIQKLDIPEHLLAGHEFSESGLAGA